MTSKKYKPSDGAVGPATALSFANSILSTSVGLHFPSPTNFRLPTIFLTCRCKKDLA